LRKEAVGGLQHKVGEGKANERQHDYEAPVQEVVPPPPGPLVDDLLVVVRRPPVLLVEGRLVGRPQLQRLHHHGGAARGGGGRPKQPHEPAGAAFVAFPLVGRHQKSKSCVLGEETTPNQGLLFCGVVQFLNSGWVLHTVAIP